jgi:hypothetical protein
MTKIASVPSIHSVFQTPITEAYVSPETPVGRLAPAGVEWLPPTYRSKTTQGLSTIMLEIISAGARLGSTQDASTQNDFWFLWEVLNNEAEPGLYTALDAGVGDLKTDFAAGNAAANATYAIGLIYVFFVFLIVFGKVKKSIKQETKHSRNALYMVPIQVVRVTKPIMEYVENLYRDLNGN